MALLVQAVLALVWAWACGCSSPQLPAAPEAPSPAAAATEPRTAAHWRDGDASQAPWDWSQPGELLSHEEIWNVVYMAGSKVGYEHSLIEKRRRGQEALVRLIQRQVTTIRRFSESVAMTLELESWQTPEGKLLAFRGKQDQGISPIEFTGWVHGNTLYIEQQIHGRKELQQLPWSSQYGGFRAVEESLHQQPLRPGHRWTVRYLLPVFNVVAQTDLEVKGPEPVRLLSGTYELVRVDMKTHAGPGIELTGSLWVDQSGEILKTFTDLLNLESYRATREEALAESPGITFDWGEDIRVPVAGSLDRPHETTLVRYRVELAGADAARVFAVGPSQQIRRCEDGTAEITVYAIRPGRELPLPEKTPPDPPSEADRSAGPYIQSDYPPIVALAEKSTEGLSDPWEIAIALEKLVHEWITDSNYKVGFATAAEVADSRQGDCTEHALLLAALARAKKIPARVAMGLVYNKGAFYYHMWTEVWIDGVWYPLDGTLGRGGIGAAHLKMATSSLENAAALARMLPLLQAVGKLKIEILEARYADE